LSENESYVKNCFEKFLSSYDIEIDSIDNIFTNIDKYDDIYDFFDIVPNHVKNSRNEKRRNENCDIQCVDINFHRIYNISKFPEFYNFYYPFNIEYIEYVKNYNNQNLSNRKNEFVVFTEKTKNIEDTIIESIFKLPDNIISLIFESFLEFPNIWNVNVNYLINMNKSLNKIINVENHVVRFSNLFKSFESYYQENIQENIEKINDISNNFNESILNYSKINIKVEDLSLKLSNILKLTKTKSINQVIF
jgi:hypothetical protein